MQKNLKLRYDITRIARDYLHSNEFMEIETPCLTKSTPEGARDYLVPARLSHGSFYALPQSPQLFKQILMVSGYDRYFQFARCFRDEDLRADRQPEHTQIDLEMAFVEQDDVMNLVEGMVRDVFKKTLDYDIPEKVERIPYYEAMNTYGSDKPDLRFELTLNDITEVFKDTEFKVFQGAVQAGVDA